VQLNRKITVVLCTLGLAGGVAACGSSSDKTTSAGTNAASASKAAGKQITFVGPVAVPVWLAAKAGFEEEGKKLGMKTTWTAPAAVDIPSNVQQVEAALASGADGIVTCSLDPKAYAPVLQEAKSKGVPVVLTDCDVPDKASRLAFVGTIGQSFGKQSAEKLSQIVGGKGNVVVMQGQFDAQIQNDILAGFKQGIAASPGLKIVAREADNSDVQTAVQKFEDVFQAHPEAKIVYCIEAGCAGAAATVAKERHLKLTIMGTDDNKETVQGIRDGTITLSAAQPFHKMGRLAAQSLADHFDGKKVPSITDTGVIFIEKSNVDSYANQER
jgi:ABC-type sugar transport system substrate-binding protein